MTCKDCIHQEACLDWCRGFGEEAEKCEHFKDKSRFIELPCKVGDTVYMPIKSLSTILNCLILSIEFNNGKFAFCDDCGNEYILSDFGELIFSSKKEAEQALKEMI